MYEQNGRDEIAQLSGEEDITNDFEVNENPSNRSAIKFNETDTDRESPGEEPASLEDLESLFDSTETQRRSMPETDENNTSTETQKPASAEKSSTDSKPMAISECVLNDVLNPKDVGELNDSVSRHMRNTLVLSCLQDEEFTEERNAVYRWIWEEIETEEDLKGLIERLFSTQNNQLPLDDLAPNACKEINDYLRALDIDQELLNAGYDVKQIPDDFKERMRLSLAYAEQIGGPEGEKWFGETLGEFREKFREGIKNPNLALAISGTLVGLGVALGTGPAGLVVSTVSLGRKMLDTPAGQDFSNRVVSSIRDFLADKGVSPELLDRIGHNTKTAWNNLWENKWARRAAIVGGVALAGFNLSSMFDVSNIPSAHDLLGGDAPIPGADDSGTLSYSNPTDADTTVATESAPATAESHSVTVQRGDTLWQLMCEHYQSTHGGETPTDMQIINMVNTFSEYNDIADPNKILPGQTFKFPNDMNPSRAMISSSTDWLSDTGSEQHAANLKENAESWREGRDIAREPGPSLPDLHMT